MQICSMKCDLLQYMAIMFRLCEDAKIIVLEGHENESSQLYSIIFLLT